jgi:hypothetical protein
MPYSFDLLDEEQAKGQSQGNGQGDPSQAAPAMTGGGQTFSGGSGAASTDTSAKPSTQFNNTPGTANQGSGFVNLDKYLTANQGNNFGDQFTGKVQGDVDQAKSTLQNSTTDFTNASNQGTTSWNTIGDQVKGIVDNAGDNTTAADATTVQNDANATYNGPQDFTGSAYGGQALGSAQKASQETGALQNEGGRFALLDQFYGRPNYSTGEKSLDGVLAQQGQGVAARQAALGTQGQVLQGNVNQSAQNLDNLATANNATTQDAASQTKNYLGTAQTNFDTDLNNRFAGYNTANAAYNTGVQNGISTDNLSDEDLALFGLQSGQNLYNTDLSSYVNETPAQANLGQFASDQDYAKSAALAQLAGEDPTDLTAANRGEAGTASTMGRDTIDTSRLSNDISTEAQNYAAEMGPAQAALDQNLAAQKLFQQQLADPSITNQDSKNQIAENLRNAQAIYNQQKSAIDNINAAYNSSRKVGGATSAAPPKLGGPIR